MHFAIDDPLPTLVLPTRNGAPANLSDQSFAGTTLVLWITGAEVPAAGVAEAERLAPKFHEVDARLIHLAAANPSTVAPARSDALLQLFDPNGAVRKTLGLDGSGVVVIDANRRLRAIIPRGCPEHTLEVCRSEHRETQADIICRHAPVLLVPRVLDEALCETLIDYWERSEKKENAVALGAQGASIARSHIKRRIDAVVLDRALYATVKQRIERRVLVEMKKCLHFEAARMEALRVGCYDSAVKGAFGRHRDNMTPFTAHRRFAMSLNLNCDYDGGALVFAEYGRERYRPNRGDAVVFSCSLLHEALPVTEGRRFGLFTFFTDCAGAAQEDAMLAERGAEVISYDIK